MYGENDYVFHYRGIPWYVVEEVAPAITITHGSTLGASTSSNTTVTITHSAVPNFAGVSSSRVGSVISVSGTGGSFTGRITAVNTTNPASTVLTIASPSNTTLVTAITSLTFPRANVIYGVQFDEEDGTTAVIHSNTAVPAGTVGEYHGPIGGFSAEDLGILDDRLQYRTRLDWFGNFVVHTPYALGRLVGFSIPNYAA